ncbi:hypothetical protein B0H14DRAFT_2639674 [Mycena olivaceomarginata]|nr:hypothetical protein B0H14DRAFT_2639674 [Mycena olivaceomarginata]
MVAPTKPCRGRGGGSRGGRGGAGGRKVAAAASKRSPPLDSDYEDGSAPKKARRKAEKIPDADGADSSVDAPAARERSSRAGAGSNMAELVAFVEPRAKRTHAEVLAANAQAAEKSRRVNANHAKTLADEEANAVYGLDDVPDEDETQADENESMLEITQEDLDRIEDDDASGSEYGESKPKIFVFEKTS